MAGTNGQQSDLSGCAERSEERLAAPHLLLLRATLLAVEDDSRMPEAAAALAACRLPNRRRESNLRSASRPIFRPAP